MSNKRKQLRDQWQEIPVEWRSPRTPPSINSKIKAFCKTLSAEVPIYVSVKAWPQNKTNECFENVADYVKANGGSMQHGWTIWEKQILWLEAEFHACVLADGKYVDVTPKEDNESRILFLPDPARVWNETPVMTEFYATSDRPFLKELIDAHKQFNEWKAGVAVRIGWEKPVVGKDADKVREFQSTIESLEKRLIGK